MSRGGVDYSKWDTVCEEGSDEEGVRDEFEPLQTQKQVADELFESAELSHTPSGYLQAVDRYDDLAPELRRVCQPFVSRSRCSNQTFLYAKRLQLSCLLNAACCFIRLERWPQVLARVEEAFVIVDDAHLQSALPVQREQRLRARQFRAMACLALGGKECISRAQKDAEAISKAVKAAGTGSSDDSLSAALVEELQDLCEQVRQACLSVGMGIVKIASELQQTLADDEQPGPIEQGVKDLEAGWLLLQRRKDQDKGSGGDALALEAASVFNRAIQALQAVRFSQTSSSSSSSSQEQQLLRRLWQGLVTALYSREIGDLASLADAYIGYAKCLPSATQQAEEHSHSGPGPWLLKAATCRFKLKQTAQAQELYAAAVTAFDDAASTAAVVVVESQVLALVGQSPPAEQKYSRDPETETETETGADRAMLAAVARTGLGVCLAQQEQSAAAIDQLSSASQTLLQRLRELTAGETETVSGAVIEISGGQTRSATIQQVSAVMQHLWTAFDGLVEAYSALECYDAAARAADEALLASDLAIDYMTAATDSSSASASTSATAGAVASLRKRRAVTLLSRGHLVCARARLQQQQRREARLLDADDHSNYGTEAAPSRASSNHLPGDAEALRRELECTSHVEAAASYWRLAALELSALGDFAQASKSYCHVAVMWQDAAGVEPFKHGENEGEGGDRGGPTSESALEAAEAAHDAWRLAAQESLKLARGALGNSSSSSSSSGSAVTARRARREAMHAFYRAGVCALRFSEAAALRAMEAALQAMRDADGNVGASTVKPAVVGGSGKEDALLPENASELAHQVACGDVLYYSSHCRLKAGQAAEALAAATDALHVYTRCQDRKKRKLALQLRCLAHAAVGDQALAEADIQALRGLCLMPLEDPDKEVQLLRGIVGRRFREVVPPASMPPSLRPPEAQSRFSWAALSAAFGKVWRVILRDDNVGGLITTTLLMCIFTMAAVTWLRQFLAQGHQHGGYSDWGGSSSNPEF